MNCGIVTFRECEGQGGWSESVIVQHLNICASMVRFSSVSSVVDLPATLAYDCMVANSSPAVNRCLSPSRGVFLKPARSSAEKR